MAKVSANIKIKGIVQGVGFRPFIHRLVSQSGLFGNVKNTAFGASLVLEGEKEEILTAIEKIRENAPALAYIESVEVTFSEKLFGFSDFKIAESEIGERKTLVSPDVATCPDCLRELYDKNNRRYRYPFINCTNCGPRFTIIRDIPYDRKNTTMEKFPMCTDCGEEYGDIENRRYHAEPTCCETCGPEVFFLGKDGKRAEGDAFSLAREMIKKGGIVAVKGLGGFHIACDAQNPDAVRLLRKRKHRDEKPFAIMCRDASEARKFAEVSEDEEKYLISHRRPIVLLKKRRREDFSHISENGYVGIMLPYTPVHHMLLEEGLSAVVMTSGNISDLPIIYKDEEMYEKLCDVCDGFLTNNRDIYMRCDDSLMWVKDGKEYFARRSRGYVPYPVTVEGISGKILACGAEQKASFAMSRGSHVFPSQHIGDLKNLETLENYEEQISRFERLMDIKPTSLVCDMHPDYLSTEYAEKRAKKEGIPLIKVQHHHAHMASCMADNGYFGKCIGIIWDGTGYGLDGKVWGAEFLTGDYKDFERRGTILPIRLPGGDRAAKEISRIGKSLLCEVGKCEDESIKKLLELNINCPEVTSMGRLFDGVSAILGICEKASYEGQGAIFLESLAREDEEKVYPYTVSEKDGMYIFDWRDMISEIAEEKDISSAAAAFMNTLVSMSGEIAMRISRDTGIRTVALSGGTFQNMYMLTRLEKKLSDMGFNVLTHHRVSCNDEGLSLGQLLIGAEKKI